MQKKLSNVILAQMSNTDRDRGFPIDEIYQEYADLVLKHFGWPEWPPSEIPNQNEWWTQSISVKPQKTHLPYTSFVEFDGSPQSGRSILSRNVLQQYSTEQQVWTLEVTDQDLTYAKGPAIIYQNLEMIYPPSQIPDDDLPSTWLHDMGNTSWLDCIHYEINKAEFWAQQHLRMVRSAKSNQPKVVFGLRGPLDSVIFSYALASERNDQNFTIPDDFRDAILPHMLKTVCNQHTLAAKNDAVVLIGISQEEAQRRRMAAGKTSKSWITDSSFYNTLSAWYGYYLANVWPKIHEAHGTGLLVLDGAKPIEENVEVLLTYLSDIGNVWL